MKVKYKRVDSLVHGEVKEIKLIGEDPEYEKEKHYFVFCTIITMNLVLHV